MTGDEAESCSDELKEESVEGSENCDSRGFFEPIILPFFILAGVEEVGGGELDGEVGDYRQRLAL